jgi:hypothetical protein
LPRPGGCSLELEKQSRFLWEKMEKRLSCKTDGLTEPDQDNQLWACGIYTSHPTLKEVSAICLCVCTCSSECMKVFKKQISDPFFVTSWLYSKIELRLYKTMFPHNLWTDGQICYSAGQVLEPLSIPTF